MEKTCSGLVKEVTQNESVSRATQSCTCALSDSALRLLRLSLTGCSLLDTRSLFLKNNTKQQMAQNRRAAILMHLLTLDSKKYWQDTPHNHYLWCTSDYAARWPAAKTAASWNVLHSSSQLLLERRVSSANQFWVKKMSAFFWPLLALIDHSIQNHLNRPRNMSWR